MSTVTASIRFRASEDVADELAESFRAILEAHASAESVSGTVRTHVVGHAFTGAKITIEKTNRVGTDSGEDAGATPGL